ncbi:hypothetical protein PAXINDRAFT_158446 [Paxillus involutus ATCC 200175]|uniref:Uncharacterized protein n=1 Tax=Paxillus involutus ATCC 200175 TaxID=664439 RepID=A0A0C9TH66_PAXIN|nr:hypothetical protein PAXINDRAFT_158446 [Paxillus involutus ATCC 200175]
MLPSPEEVVLQPDGVPAPEVGLDLLPGESDEVLSHLRIPTLDKGKARAIDVDVDHLPVAGPSRLQQPLPLVPPRKSKSLPVGNGPQYATQMPAAFTAQNAHEEEIEERRQQEDKECIEAVQKANNTVTDDTAPSVRAFQEGFKLPNFLFSPAVLKKLRIFHLDVERYDRLLDTWVGFDARYTVMLMKRDNGVLLVKTANVQWYLHFDRYLKQVKQPGSPNIVKHLPAEHTFMRRSMSREPLQAVMSPLLGADTYDAYESFYGAVLDKDDAKVKHRVPTVYNVRPSSSLNVGRVPTIYEECPHFSNADPSQAAKQIPTIMTKRAKYVRSDSVISLTDSGDSSEQDSDSYGTTTAKMKGKQCQASPLSPHSRHASHHDDSPEYESDSPDSPVAVPAKHRFSGQRRSSRIWVSPSSESIESSGATSSGDSSISPSSSPSQSSDSPKPVVKKEALGLFGIKFVSSTFYDNRRIWEYEENRELHKRFVAYGHTKKGRWTAFMSKAKRPPK